MRDGTGGGAAYDVDGALAARGAVHEPLPRRLLDEPYYALPAPKTTGKELFHGGYLRDALAGFLGLPVRDVVATPTNLTARTVAGAALAVRATEVIASGGGTRNPVLMRLLGAELAGVPLRVSDELGLLGTVASSTGARRPSVLGSVTPGRAGFPPGPPDGTRPPVRLVVGWGVGGS